MSHTGRMSLGRIQRMIQKKWEARNAVYVASCTLCEQRIEGNTWPVCRANLTQHYAQKHPGLVPIVNRPTTTTRLE